MTIEHGNADHVGAGPPATIRVCLDILLVHKSHVFQQKDVWFLVYDGSLPDAMLSETLLNNIPCIDSPGTTLIDTRARGSDISILLQQMDDYQQLNAHRVNVARLDIAREKLTARVNVAMPSAASSPSDAPGTSASNASAQPAAPSDTFESASVSHPHALSTNASQLCWQKCTSNGLDSWQGWANPFRMRLLRPA